MSSEDGEIALRLAAFRKQLGFSQTVMAAKLGVSERAYKYYETGKRDFPSSVALSLCRLFNADLNWILIGEGTMKRVDRLALYDEAILATLHLCEIHGTNLTGDRIVKVARKAMVHSMQNGSEPEAEVKSLFEIFV